MPVRWLAAVYSHSLGCNRVPRASRHLLAATMCRRLEDELVAIAQLEKRAWRASIEVRRPRASRVHVHIYICAGEVV